MAKVLSYELLPRVVLPQTYAIIGETRLNHFHQTASVDFYIFESEDARHQRLAEREHELHRPIKIITVKTTIETYEKYIDAPAKDLAAAWYRLITEVPQGASAEPQGLKELMERADDQ